MSGRRKRLAMVQYSPSNPSTPDGLQKVAAITYDNATPPDGLKQVDGLWLEPGDTVPDGVRKVAALNYSPSDTIPDGLLKLAVLPDVDDLPSSGLVLWLDASRISGLADGAAVSTWPDRSGNGYDAAQGTAANQPAYKTGIINGLPVVRFGGINDYMTLPAGAWGMLRNVAGGTVFMVLQADAQGTGSPQYAVNICTNVDGAGRLALGLEATTTDAIELRCRALDAESVSTLVGASFRDNAWFLVALWVDYAAADGVVRKNGLAIASTTSLGVTPGNTSDTDSAQIYIGTASGVPSFPLDGDIGELLVYNRALSASEIAAVEAYLAGKWGIQLRPTLSGTPAATVIVLAAEQATGTLTVGTWYRITATEVNHFYTGSAVGQSFVAAAATVLDANNKVRRILPAMTDIGIFGRRNGEWRCYPTIAADSIAGMLVVADRTQTWGLRAYVNRFLGTAVLAKKLNDGLDYELATGAVTYVAGAPLDVVVHDTTLKLYYNGALVGAAVTGFDWTGFSGTRAFGWSPYGNQEFGLLEVRE